MQSYILTAGGRKVTATAAPLMPDDVLYIDGVRQYRAAKGSNGFLRWVRS